MITTILTGIGGGLLLELLGMIGVGGGKAVLGVKAAAMLVRLLGLAAKLRDRMGPDEQREFESVEAEARRLGAR